VKNIELPKVDENKKVKKDRSHTQKKPLNQDKSNTKNNTPIKTDNNSERKDSSSTIKKSANKNKNEEKSGDLF
jgi:hypothetical protein